MILAEKIMSLRKQLNLSQEELADKLNVSRQSISKWELGSSIPELNKIIQMSELFGVSTDYLLKDDADDEGVVTTINLENDKHFVTLEEANKYLDLIKASSKKIALGILLCLWAPGLFMLSKGLEEVNYLSNLVTKIIGFGGLMLLVLVAVIIFVFYGSKLEKYEYLEKEELNLQYGVEAYVKREKDNFENAFQLGILLGLGLIFVGIIPLCIYKMMGGSDYLFYLFLAFLFLMVGLGVYFFIHYGLVNEAFDKLLQLDDYLPKYKKAAKKLEWFYGAYWLVITLIYLSISFLWGRWDISWVVYALGGVLFAVLHVVLREFVGKDK